MGFITETSSSTPISWISLTQRFTTSGTVACLTCKKDGYSWSVWWVYRYIYIYIWYVCMYDYVCMCMYVYIYMYIYICMYVCVNYMWYTLLIYMWWIYWQEILTIYSIETEPWMWYFWGKNSLKTMSGLVQLGPNNVGTTAVPLEADTVDVCQILHHPQHHSWPMAHLL